MLKHTLAALTIGALSAVTSTTWAEEINLLSNPSITAIGSSGLPTSWSHQLWVVQNNTSQNGVPCPASTPLPPLCYSYQYGTDSAGYSYLDLRIINSTTERAYSNLFIDSIKQVSAGEPYRIGVVASRIDPGVTLPANAVVGLGFHLYYRDENQAVRYIGEAATAHLNNLSFDDRLISHFYQTGTPWQNTGRTPTIIQPRLSSYVPGNSTIALRIKSPTLFKGIRLASLDIDPLTSLPRQQSATPGQSLRFSVNLTGRPAVPSTATIQLTNEVATHTYTHEISPSSNPHASDVWEVYIPNSISLGTYILSYRLNQSEDNSPLQLLPEPGVTTSPSNNSYEYEIGTVNIVPNAGIYLGQHFHGHPGRPGLSRANGPVLVPYHFVRSHDSENVGATRWWIADPITNNPDGKYDWTEFDRWANFHAPTPGQKKLLITFFGSPTWASSKPSEPSPYNILGLNAPPANIISYQKMVAATVNRYQDRIFAVECWNEPGNESKSSFYTGTGTELADICKAIHTATKSINPSIPTLCPAEADFLWLLTQQTSEGEPLHEFCDWVGAHPYDHTGVDNMGESYTLDKIGPYIDNLSQQLRQLNLDKPIFISEWGMDCNTRPSQAHPSLFIQNMPAKERAQLLHDTIATAKEKGVIGLGLYSYDSTSILRRDGTQCGQFGYEGIASFDPNTQTFHYDPIVADSIQQAFQKFGKTLP